MIRFCSLITFIVLVMFASCKSDLKQAKNSLEGHWEVQSITSFYPGMDGFQRVDQQDPGLGYFNFSDDELEFEYTRNDTLYATTTTWSLTSRKENSGFTKVLVFTLTLGNGEIYECIFEDQTKNSEKNASEITLTTTTLVDLNEENAQEFILVKD